MCSQEELAKKIGIHANVVGRYERDEAKPSIEIAQKIAEFLNVSLDYLVGRTNEQIDLSLLDQLLVIQKLPEKEKEHITFTINALIRDAKARIAYSDK